MAAIISLISERNIVFQVVELARRLLSGRLGLACLGCHRGLLRRARFAAAFPLPKHLHHLAADFSGVAVLSVLVLPLAGAQAPFDIDLRALLQVFPRNLSQATEEGYPVPFGGLFHLAACLVLPSVGRSNPDVADRLAAR